MIYVNVLGQIPRAQKCSHSGWNKYVTSLLLFLSCMRRSWSKVCRVTELCAVASSCVRQTWVWFFVIRWKRAMTFLKAVLAPQTTKGRFRQHMVQKSKPTPKEWDQFKIYLFQIWMMFITESSHNALYLQLAVLQLLIHFSNDRQSYALRFQIAGQVPNRPTMREWW